MSYTITQHYIYDVIASTQWNMIFSGMCVHMSVVRQTAVNSSMGHQPIKIEIFLKQRD